MIRCAFLSLALCCSMALPASPQAEFYEGSLLSAIDLAEKENKLVLLVFYLEYNYDSKVMDKTTWNDDRVAEAIRESYIAVKIDPEKESGKAQKEKYQIKTIPTILVLDSKGSELGRHENALDAGQMLEILKTNSALKNNLDNPNNAEIYESLAKTDVAAPPSIESQSPATKPLEFLENDDSQAVPVNQTQNSPAYGVQLGVFSNIQNAQNFKSANASASANEIYITEALINGKKLYRVIAGSFRNKSQAEELKATLKSKKIEGLVRSF